MQVKKSGYREFLRFALVFLALQILWNPQLDTQTLAQPSYPYAGTSTSSPIAISTNGETVIAVNPDSNSVTLIDAASNTVLGEITVGDNPQFVAISPDGARAFVSNLDSDSISIIDVNNQVMTSSAVIGDQPSGVLLSPDGEHLFVALKGEDKVVVLEPEQLTIQDSLSLHDRPYGLAYTPKNNRLLVSHLLSGGLSIITYPPLKVYLPLVQITTAGGTAAIPANQTRPKQSTMTGQTIYPATTVQTWPNVAPAPAVLIDVSGTRAYLAQTMANGLGMNTQFDTTVFPKVSVVNLLSESHQIDEHISLPETDRPVGLPWSLALTKNDSELWVVNSASNDISVIDLGNPTNPQRTANIPVGDNPRGIAIAPQGDYAYVNNTLAGTVSVIDTLSYTVTNVITTTTIPLPPALLNGKRLFFSSARPELAKAAWISCNTCHIEGEHDGRTWMLQFLGSVPPGELPIIRRNTTSLLGMIETYPLRWSAEWDESADSEFSIRFEQFGDGLIAGDMHPTLGAPNQERSYDLDCLALFIDSLAVPSRQQNLNEAALRGKALFESTATQCISCHPPPLYTDLQVHDVGTASGSREWFGPLIDTPSLRFLFDSAPYLHDGSAAQIVDVLTSANPNDMHGVTSHLTPSEIEDLSSFLLELPYE